VSPCLLILWFSWYGPSYGSNTLGADTCAKRLAQIACARDRESDSCLTGQSAGRVEGPRGQPAINGERHSGDGGHAALPSHEAPKPIWEQFIEAFKDVPDEELEHLPSDGA